MPTQVQQRQCWNGEPEQLRELFTLSKQSGARARCVLWSHLFGWELRLDVNGSLVRSQVMRNGSEIETVSVDWRDGMIKDGWRQIAGEDPLGQLPPDYLSALSRSQMLPLASAIGRIIRSRDTDGSMSSRLVQMWCAGLSKWVT
jgi:hypothetical protein